METIENVKTEEQTVENEEKTAKEGFQALTFMLNDEIFGVDINSVREVLDFTSITKVPQTPDFMSGVINLRGNVAPVIDLKMKFGLPATERTVDTCIIIIEVEIEDEEVVLGALADSVQEVLSLNPAEIEEAPKIGTQLDTSFIRGMAKKDENFVIILDVDKIFTFDEVESMKTT